MIRIHHLRGLGRALRAWFAISLQTFGGPAGQIAVMQRTLVDEPRHPLGPVHLEVPELGTLRPVELGITVLAAVLIFRVKVSVLRTLGVCAAVGLAAGLTGLTVS